MFMQTIIGGIHKEPKPNKIKKLFIGNINLLATNFAELDKIISDCGPYTALNIHYERPKCYAFVTFATAEVAAAAKTLLDGKMFHDRALRCHFEVPP